jgi:hypothetical protein
MAKCDNIQIAEAVKNLVNASLILPAGLLAVRRSYPKIDLSVLPPISTGGPQWAILVGPHNWTKAVAGRGVIDKSFTTGVFVAGRCPTGSNAEIDPLVVLANALGDFLLEAELRSVAPGDWLGIVMSVTCAEVYSTKEMKDINLFATVMAVTVELTDSK